MMNTKRKKALIIGGGVAGPVAAMALQCAGIEATIYEAYPQRATDVGSYLTVATNGLDALSALDLHRPVLAAGFPTSHIVLLSGSGKRLGKVPTGGTLPGGIGSITIKRAHLHRALHEQAASRGIRFEFGKRLIAADTTAEGGVIAHFEDGSQASGDLLIGCDGVHSVTRRLIDPTAPAGRYVGLANFGGYTRDFSAPTEAGVWHMIFGKRAFFGYVGDPDGGIVWFANVPRGEISQAERQSTTNQQWQAHLLDLFADDHGLATKIIAAGELELAAGNTYDLPSVPTWHNGSMVIIGDAAHAPSPTSGQGASLAMEDAVILAQCLRDFPTNAEAFATYERLRRQRVERIVAEGARQSNNKLPGFLRDLMMPLIFKFFVTEKALSWVHDHHINWNARLVPAGNGANSGRLVAT
jgi:FAD-dependent urate hydroxylase